MKELRAVVSGKVQGVSFRDFVLESARNLGLKGYVRNVPDGTVFVLAQGSESELKILEENLHQGSSASSVEQVQCVLKDVVVPHTSFEVVF